LNGAAAWAALVCLTAGLLLAAFFLLAIHNLDYPGMWWDEATQFWVSQGISRYSPSFCRSGGVRDVVRMNCLENLDPGGFSILLHAWTKCGCGLVWLRTLPLVFFIVGALALGLLGWRLTRSVLFALGACAVPSLYPAALYFGLEIRAYSMEMAGVTVGALALAYAQERPRPARAFLLGLTCAAFLTSRYSFIFVALVLGAALVSLCARDAHRRSAASCVVAFLVPVGLIAVPVWWVTLRYQLWNEMRGGPLGITSPGYTRTAILGHGVNALELIGRNLFTPAALPITACIFAAVFVRRRVYARLARDSHDPELGDLRSRCTMLTALIVGVQAASIMASALGLYPWDIASRWSAYLVMLSALAMVVLAAEASSLVRAWLPAGPDAGFLLRHRKLLGAGVAALVVIAGSRRAMVHRQTVEALHRTNVALQLDRLPWASLHEHKVFVAYYEVPMVRYLYEYGPYRGRSEYPRVFRFETGPEWQSKAPIAVRAESIAFFVSAVPLAEAQARFPGATLRPFGPPGSRLLAVSMPADGS
jgi:uncharacterized membrane protein YiaA